MLAELEAEQIITVIRGKGIKGQGGITNRYQFNLQKLVNSHHPFNTEVVNSDHQLSGELTSPLCRSGELYCQEVVIPSSPEPSVLPSIHTQRA